MKSKIFSFVQNPWVFVDFYLKFTKLNKFCIVANLSHLLHQNVLVFNEIKTLKIKEKENLSFVFRPTLSRWKYILMKPKSFYFWCSYFSQISFILAIILTRDHLTVGLRQVKWKISKLPYDWKKVFRKSYSITFMWQTLNQQSNVTGFSSVLK